jgi:hypothetical protein
MGQLGAVPENPHGCWKPSNSFRDQCSCKGRLFGQFPEPQRTHTTGPWLRLPAGLTRVARNFPTLLLVLGALGAPRFMPCNCLRKENPRPWSGQLGLSRGYRQSQKNVGEIRGPSRLRRHVERMHGLAWNSGNCWSCQCLLLSKTHRHKAFDVGKFNSWWIVVSRLHTCKVPTSLDRLAHAATSPTLRKFQRGCQERFCNYRQTNDQPHLAQWKELLRHLLEEYRHARFGSRRCPGSFHCSVRGHYSRVEGRHGRHASVLSLFGTCGDVDLDS